jgi:hypothetical protein
MLEIVVERQFPRIAIFLVFLTCGLGIYTGSVVLSERIPNDLELVTRLFMSALLLIIARHFV